LARAPKPLAIHRLWVIRSYFGLGVKRALSSKD
jgi:hypothetical protein